jgi:hypothetical protein
VVDGGRDQEGGGAGGEQQRHEVDRLLEVRDVREALVERHHEQEREQHLHPGNRDPKLLEELHQVAVEPLPLGFVPTRARLPIGHAPEGIPIGRGFTRKG